MAEQAHEVVRTGLRRMVPFTLERATADPYGNDGLTLEGHAAVFGEPTVINSWEGRFTEQVAPGAFRKTFRERTPVLQFDHGTHPLIGSIPLGRFIDGTPKEDDLGAFIRARLSDNWLVQPVRDAIASETVSGMSFRFEVIADEWRDKNGDVISDPEELLRLMWDDNTDYPVRTLQELRVPELGPVVFPAYEGTDVAVRSVNEPTIIDLGELARNSNERVTLARSLFLAERATLGHSSTEAPVTPDGPLGERAGEEPPALEKTTEVAERMARRLAAIRR